MNSFINYSKCPICSKSGEKLNSSCYFNEWKEDKTFNFKVERYKYSAYACCNCGHQFFSGDYSIDMLTKFYPNGHNAEAIKSHPGVYMDIIEMIHEQKIPHNNVADLGGGDGSLLIQLREKLGLKSGTVYEFEDKKRPLLENINFIGGVNLSSYCSSKILKNHDLGFLCHVLEHLPNPHEIMKVAFKCKIRHLIVDVPSVNLTNNSTEVRVVHPQHIHYFSINSLCNLGEKNGFHLSYAKEIITDGVPRISAILTHTELAEKYKLAIILSNKQKIRKIFKDKVASNPNLCIYGIGDEFLDIYDEELRDIFLARKNIKLIDGKRGGRKFDGLNIYKPEILIKEKLDCVVIMSSVQHTLNQIKSTLREINVNAPILTLYEFTEQL